MNKRTDYLTNKLEELDEDSLSSSYLASLMDVLARKKEKAGERERREKEEKAKEKARVESFVTMEIPLDFENVFENDQGDFSELVSVSDAFIHSLNNLGKVDIEYISKISGKNLKEVILELGDAIFLDPQKWDGDEQFYKGWVSREEYLSGNLYTKYQLAYEYNKRYPGFFKRNLEALEKVMPRKLKGGEIFITLGSPWVPADIIADFARSHFSYSYIAHDDYTGSWYVDDKMGYGVASTVTYGTKKINALNILEKTLNLAPIVVRKETIVDGKAKMVVDDKETALALEKQRVMVEAFQKWVWEDKRRKQRLESIYYEKFGCHRKREYDGSFLTLPGLNPEVRLYDYQRNAVARVLLSKNVLLAHDVGSGKTYEMIAAGHELKRIGRAKKVMYVAPNNIVSQWEKIYRVMYPQAGFLVVTNKNFDPEHREETLKKIRDEDYDGIIIDYSSFDMIRLSIDFYAKQWSQKHSALVQAQSQNETKTSTVNRRLSSLQKSWVLQMAKLRIEYDRLGTSIYFDDLGIDALFVDEAHNFKNVPFDTMSHDLLGLNPQGSDRCQRMMDKVHYIQATHNGGGVVFATGTPITNSIADAFIMQKYLQDGELFMAGIGTFDAWAQTFAEVRSEFEIDVTATGFRLGSRLAKFHNLPELASFMSGIADFHHLEQDESLPQFNGYRNVLIPKSEELEGYLEKISRRADLIRKGEPSTVRNSKGEVVTDNMLLITTDGRKAALDLRLIDAQRYPFLPDSKVYRCAENVYRFYREHEEKGLTQIVFCDVSVPKDAFNIYQECKRLLMDMGVPEREIAFIHDANTEGKRNALFKRFNEGKVRILVGSTFKLGIGANVQRKLIAIHHIDVPWRPSDMVQREGRIIRPGNENEEVFVYRYITEHSFDAYSWQLLETKQSFISKLLNDEVYQRDIGDIDNTVLNYAEVKALAIGNPLIKERVETHNEILKLRGLRAKSGEASSKLCEDILEKESLIDSQKKRLNAARKDGKYLASLDWAKLETAGKRALGESIIKGVFRANAWRMRTRVGNYMGFEIFALPDKGEGKRTIELIREGTYPLEVGSSDLGAVVRIDNYLQDFPGFIASLEQSIVENERFVKAGRKELLTKEPYTERILALEKKLQEIDMKLGVEK